MHRRVAATHTQENTHKQNNNTPAASSPNAETDRLLPGGAAGLLWRDWSIAPGVALCDAKDRGFVYTLAFKKQPQVCLCVVCVSLCVCLWGGAVARAA